MNRYVCIHGHFYQPPRENPWLEHIELQDSARPYHDWNERINDECYAPNTASRILNSDRKIIDVVDNYPKISFNFGPTLLSWMEDKAPEIYRDIVKADKKSQKRFSGHGSAIAQPYNHMIMPLANEEDKRSQVIWGIEDFKHRFGRDPEGMWLPETAVDLVTLDILAEQGIKFTILAPHQAKRIKKIGEEEWKDVSEEEINPKRPYLCRLPSGRTINLFFYDGPISKDVGFGDLLADGEKFANRLLDAFSEKGEEGQIVNIATDGETYGHHHRFGDMTLAKCLHEIESSDTADLTIYGEYLENNPPKYEVEIFENTSWSCSHGVERWKNDCGCDTGTHPDWNQKWRAPLREALNWLRDTLIPIYEREIGPYIKDPWKARNQYIKVILNRSEQNVRELLDEIAEKELSREETIKTLKLLEMQRHAMLMFTSCGWFFDEISDVEPVQILQYAARAMQIAQEFTGENLEHSFLEILENAPSNVPEYSNGAEIFRKLVKTSIVDFDRLAAHYSVSSLFEDYEKETKVHCFTVEKEMYEMEEIGEQKLAGGKLLIQSDITWEEKKIAFSVLHMGGHNIIGGVISDFDEEHFSSIFEEIMEAFSKSNISEAFHLIDESFGENNYSLWHLFKDEQRKVLKQILEPKIEEIKTQLQQSHEDIYPTIRAMKEIEVPLPKSFRIISEYVLNSNLKDLLRQEEMDTDHLKRLVEKIEEEQIELDEETISFEASQKINTLVERLTENPKDDSMLKEINNTLKTLNVLELDLNLWKAQNAYFSIGKELYGTMDQNAEKGDEKAEKWVEHFDEIGNQLNVKIS